MEPVYGFFYGICQDDPPDVLPRRRRGAREPAPSGGYIVAANHASHLDPPIVGQFLPRQVSFFARKTLWKPGIAAWWLDKVGTIPVDRDGGTSLDAIKRVLQALAAGKVVIVFPEGTRSPTGELQPPKAGVGLLACKARVPVVPARVFGSFEAFGRTGEAAARVAGLGHVRTADPPRGIRPPGRRQGTLYEDGRAHHGGDNPDRASPLPGRLTVPGSSHSSPAALRARLITTEATGGRARRPP
jgi:1-acyl-sn-glycerol-3-phosphate acyltransferase